ncbi:MAG: hypothetical protein WBV22_01935, partial [Anaerolineaceae bacterium]
MKRTILLFSALIMMLTGCSDLTQPRVSDAEIATKVALLKLTTNPGQATQGNGIVLATVQTSTPQLTATATTTPITPPTDPVTWLGTPTWRDTFNGTNNFYTTSDENIQFSYSGDAFSMTALSAGGWHSWSLGNRRISNFYLEALFKVGACSGNDKYGLVFRAPDTSQGYFYGVSCDGKFGLIRWDSMSQLIDWKPAVSLHAGPNQSNRVGVMARGNELTLYINGEQVDKITNDRYT